MSYKDPSSADAMPTTGYAQQLSLLHDDTTGNSTPMRKMRALHTQLLEKRSNLLRVAKKHELREANDYYSSKGVDADYFSKTSPVSFLVNGSATLAYWPQRSLRNWDGYDGSR